MICTILASFLQSIFLNTDPSFDGHIHSNTHHRRSLFPFLGDALRWLTGTVTTEDVSSIKKHVNQLTEIQSIQQETLVHIVSILNVTRYAMQGNRHSINILMDKVGETSQDVNNLYNLTTSLATSPQLSPTCTIHQVSPGKSSRLTILHQNSFYTHHGLH